MSWHSCGLKVGTVGKSDHDQEQFINRCKKLCTHITVSYLEQWKHEEGPAVEKR